MARPQTRTTRKPPARFDTLTLVVGGLFVIIAIITAIVGFKVVGDLVRSWTMTPLDGISINSPKTTQVNAKGTPIPVDVPLQSNGPTPQPWDGTSRVSVLVMGLDFRDWQSGDVPRTDTMILITMDPLTKTAGMLSIPRDLWVNIPNGYGYHKINQAYYFGALNKIPGGGPGLAVETVKKFLGVPINFYAQIDFSAFVDFINELGGITIKVPAAIRVDPLGEHNTVFLEPGTQLISGEVALAYARARYTDGGDFDRSKRQMQVIEAIREKITTLNMLPTLITKAPALYAELSAGIKTNLTLDQVIQLALFAVQIPKGKITQGIIGPNEVEFDKSPDGLDILIPIPDRIRMVRDSIFSTSVQVGPTAVSGDMLALAKTEKAKISVRNGSGTSGLATKTADYLRQQGLSIAEETNADRVYENTTIIIQSAKPYTQEYLRNLMSVPTARILNQYAPDAKLDIIIMLGNDWARKNPMK